MTDQGRSLFFHYFPFLSCRNLRCRQNIDLPYGLLPLKDIREEPLPPIDVDPPVTPPDEWLEVFGCIECGHLATYGQLHVYWRPVLGLEPDRRHDDATVYAVRFRCANARCKSPSTLHVDTKGGSESKLREVLAARNFVGDLKCGHSFALPPGRDAYAIGQVMNRLW
jgi:hypothetical protein